MKNSKKELFSIYLNCILKSNLIRGRFLVFIRAIVWSSSKKTCQFQTDYPLNYSMN